MSLADAACSLVDATSRRILLVDDEPRILAIVRACLEDLGGWTVAIASSGREGLALAQREAFDAILLDLSMPDMDGVAFLEALRAQPRLANLPVILLTAKISAGDRDRFEALGACGAISKPFDPLSLCDRVAQIMGWPL